jgi:hypothetical protein
MAADKIPEPTNPPPPFPPPSIPQQSPRRKKKRPASRLRVDIRRDDHEVFAILKPPIPPSSVISFEAIVPHCSAKSTAPDVSDGPDARSHSPAPSAFIDRIYCDSPTLGLEDCFNDPVRIEPQTPEPVFTPITNESTGALSQQSSPRKLASSIVSRSSSESFCVLANQCQTPMGEKMPSSLAAPLLKLGAQSRRESVLQAYDSRAPSFNSSASNNSWNIEFAIEYGVKPGETEIMPESFCSMYF